MSWLKKFLYRLTQEGGKELAIEDQQQRVLMGNPAPAISSLERMFSDCIPAIVAFKIDNGYVVRCIDNSNEGQLGSARISGFYYCKDHAAIADHIVSEAAKEKMGLNYQGTMTGRISADMPAKSSRPRSP